MKSKIHYNSHMRILIQECLKASVVVDSKEISAINNGEVIFVGFTQGDSEEIIDKMLAKRRKLRIFSDERGKTNLTLDQTKGDILCVSQFTLYANLQKGNRPSFEQARKGEEAKQLYDLFCEKIEKVANVKFGIFGADRKVHLINDGPFTIFRDSKELVK